MGVGPRVVGSIKIILVLFGIWNLAIGIGVGARRMNILSLYKIIMILFLNEKVKLLKKYFHTKKESGLFTSQNGTLIKRAC